MQKRVSSKPTETDNDKYAFRCFLLRLGFIGKEYKTARKILLRNLTGNSAFAAENKDKMTWGVGADRCPFSMGKTVGATCGR